jgi:hypothetical protein
MRHQPQCAQLISVQNIQVRSAKIFVRRRMTKVIADERRVPSLFFLFAHVLFAR